MFIYDNCTDLVLLAQALLVDHGNLVTTQIKTWAESYFPISLETWSEAEARKYLTKTMNGKEKELYDQLITVFNCHPLGIQHAVAFVQQSMISIQKYLELVEKNQLDLLCEEVAMDNGLQKSVISSFIVTIAKIEQENPSAYKLLSVMSVLDGSSMDEEFLQNIFEDQLEYITANKLLLSFNMIKCKLRTQKFRAKQINCLTMHSLYQLSIQHYLKKKGTFTETVEKCLDMMSNTSKSPGEWVKYLKQLWKDPKYNQIVIHNVFLSAENWFDCLLLKDVPLLKDIFMNVYESYKERTNDVNVYRLRILMNKLSIENADNVSKIQNDCEMNLVDPEQVDEIKSSIHLIHDLPTPTFKYYLSRFHTGDFKIINCDSFSRIISILFPVLLKELKRFDEALELFKLRPYDNHISYNSKFEIGCCEILKGNVDHGLQIADECIKESSLKYTKHLQVGRALFDVGDFEKSKSYFLKSPLYEKYDDGFPFQYLDAFAKMISLGLPENLIFENFDHHSKGRIFDYYDEIFRFNLLLICQCIRENKITFAFRVTEKVLSETKTAKDELAWIPEPFFIAKHLIRRNEYYQALWIYRVMKIVQIELGIQSHDFLREEMDIDKDIEICLKNLSKIYKINLVH